MEHWCRGALQAEGGRRTAYREAHSWTSPWAAVWVEGWFRSSHVAPWPESDFGVDSVDPSVLSDDGPCPEYRGWRGQTPARPAAAWVEGTNMLPPGEASCLREAGSEAAHWGRAEGPAAAAADGGGTW